MKEELNELIERLKRLNELFKELEKLIH